MTGTPRRKLIEQARTWRRAKGADDMRHLVQRLAGEGDPRARDVVLHWIAAAGDVVSAEFARLVLGVDEYGDPIESPHAAWAAQHADDSWSHRLGGDVTRDDTAEPPTVVVAEVDTGSFAFQAVGTTEAEAWELLRQAWAEHCRQYAPNRTGGGPLYTWAEVRDDLDVQVRTLRVGTATRDREPLIDNTEGGPQ